MRGKGNVPNLVIHLSCHLFPEDFSCGRNSGDVGLEKRPRYICADPQALLQGLFPIYCRWCGSGRHRRRITPVGDGLYPHVSVRAKHAQFSNNFHIESEI